MTDKVGYLLFIDFQSSLVDESLQEYKAFVPCQKYLPKSINKNWILKQISDS